MYVGGGDIITLKCPWVGVCAVQEKSEDDPYENTYNDRQSNDPIL